MQAKKERYINNGAKYDSMFPQANLSEKTVKRAASVDDTVKFIPKVVSETKWQTEKIAEELKGDSVRETCQNIWDFVYKHIRYHKDDEGLEQIRSPARTWHDRSRGVDCDCYTVFISTILSNLKIPHTLRITKYRKDYFQHIYPVVPQADGNYITVDCVVENFDYEEPYSEKKDKKMDLQYLDGLEDLPNVDSQDLLGNDFQETDGLGKKEKMKFKDILKKGLNLTNKLNPAVVPLRLGMLAAMKLNVFKIAQRLKWGYMSEDDAKKQGLDMDKWRRLVRVREKIENIFYTAGGKKESLKKEILTGRGNRHHEVTGLGYMADGEVFEMNERTPLPQLIGADTWSAEMEGMEEFEGFGELGEPATAATITAATGVLAAIAGLLKGIGNIFPKKDGKDQKGSEDFKNTETADNSAIDQGKNLPVTNGTNTSDNSVSTTNDNSGSDNKKMSTTNTSSDTSSTDSSNSDKPPGFWDKNKKWLKPTLWGAGGLSLLYLGYHFVTGKKKEAPAEQAKPALSGMKSKKKKHEKKESVKLM
jgi:hypothetical protein